MPYIEPANIWDEDPQITVEEWQHDVAINATRLGYWDWVEHQKESNEHQDIGPGYGHEVGLGH